MQKDFTDRVNENQGTVIQFLSEDNSHCVDNSSQLEMLAVQKCLSTFVLSS